MTRVTKIKNSTEAIWAKYHASDQKNFYKSFFIRFFFNFGHYYIHNVVKHRTGKVLDIGSGIGYHLQFENLDTIEYICFDKDPRLLAHIKDKRVKKITGDCRKIPLPSNSIDTIIVSHILEHLPDLYICIKEIKRVLKKDGKLIVVLPCDPGLLWNTMTYLTPSRARLKKLGLDYDEVMRLEHVNAFTTCVAQLQKEFTLTNDAYYPTLIKNKDFNLLGCFTATPKK